MARYRGVSSETMILAGIALMYLFSAVTSLLQYVGTAEELQAVVFWMFGSVGKSTWTKLGIVTLVLVCTIPTSSTAPGPSTPSPRVTRWRQVSGCRWSGR